MSIRNGFEEGEDTVCFLQGGRETIRACAHADPKRFYAGGGNHLKRRSFPPPAPPPSLASAHIRRRKRLSFFQVCQSVSVSKVILYLSA